MPEKAYERIESSLLLAFEGMPKLALPAQAKDKKTRILQLRVYESHSEIAGRKKVEMFHKGELDIFKRCGMTGQISVSDIQKFSFTQIECSGSSS